MRERCENPHNKSYARYGGRGIKVCERWKNYAMFLADMGRRPAGLSVERINVNGDYSPDNCRWATQTEQQNNKRNNRILEWRGERKTMMQWVKLTGLAQSTIWNRLRLGWSVDRALSTPGKRAA